MSIRVGIISDTHNLLRPQVLEVLRGCDCILHGGDVSGPALLDEIRYLGALYVVRGNNDGEWAESIARKLRFSIGGVNFLMVHNKKDVGWDLEGVDVVVYGHSHKYSEKEADGRLWLNPGSCGPRRFHQEITMAVMTISDGSFHVDKIEITP